MYVSKKVLVISNAVSLLLLIILSVVSVQSIRSSVRATRQYRDEAKQCRQVVERARKSNSSIRDELEGATVSVQGLRETIQKIQTQYEDMERILSSIDSSSNRNNRSDVD